MIHSEGTLHYENNPYKMYLAADIELARFYRSLVPRTYVCQPQRYAAHLSVIREEMPLRLEAWGKYEGTTILFEYDPEIRYNGVYWWLDCYSPRLCEIREELGLPALSELARPPSLKDCFHLTIGNSK
jgi:hypothetical protein